MAGVLQCTQVDRERTERISGARYSGSRGQRKVLATWGGGEGGGLVLYAPHGIAGWSLL